MLKETETEETMVFFVTFLSLVAFQLFSIGVISIGYAYASAHSVVLKLEQLNESLM